MQSVRHASTIKVMVITISYIHSTGRKNGKVSFTFLFYPILHDFCLYDFVVILLFCVHGKRLWSCRDGQLPNHTLPGQAETSYSVLSG